MAATADLEALGGRFGERNTEVMGRRQGLAVSVQGVGRLPALVAALLAAAGIGHVAVCGEGEVTLWDAMPGGLSLHRRRPAHRFSRSRRCSTRGAGHRHAGAGASCGGLGRPRRCHSRRCRSTEHSASRRHAPFERHGLGCKRCRRTAGATRCQQLPGLCRSPSARPGSCLARACGAVGGRSPGSQRCRRVRLRGRADRNAGAVLPRRRGAGRSRRHPGDDIAGLADPASELLRPRAMHLPAMTIARGRR